MSRPSRRTLSDCLGAHHVLHPAHHPASLDRGSLATFQAFGESRYGFEKKVIAPACLGDALGDECILEVVKQGHRLPSVRSRSVGQTRETHLVAVRQARLGALGPAALRAARSRWHDPRIIGAGRAGCAGRTAVRSRIVRQFYLRERLQASPWPGREASRADARIEARNHVR